MRNEKPESECYWRCAEYWMKRKIKNDTKDKWQKIDGQESRTKDEKKKKGENTRKKTGLAHNY